MKNKKEMKISTLIGKDCVVSGDFKAVGSARVDGIVEGNVTVEDALVLGSYAKVEGNIEAKSVIIAGEVNGNIIAPEKAELVTGAKVIGDIQTAIIVIDENAIFQGKLDMNQAAPDKRAKSKVARAGKKSAKAVLAEALGEVEEVVPQEEKVSE